MQVRIRERSRELNEDSDNMPAPGLSQFISERRAALIKFGGTTRCYVGGLNGFEMCEYMERGCEMSNRREHEEMACEG